MASTSTIASQSEMKFTYAFDEIASTSTSASASFSSVKNKLPCRVFINHRGPDVKKTLATAIYDALYATGIGVFLDTKELQLGDFLPRALEEAMRSASLHVAIFSPTYAQSPWCLAELSFILKTGKPIIPVFYGVQPTDLRWVDKGMYAQAFSKHQEKGRYSEQKIKEWKKALHKVSYYKGEVINNNDVEQEKLKNIVNRVLKEIEVVPLIVAKHPMGLEEAVIDFEKTVRESGMPQIVGIWGMGGSGKTTLAKELYNQKRSYVDGSSFVFDIRDAASKKELHKKQKYLLKDLGVKNIPPFDNIEKGKEILSNRLRNSRVLIILDNVDHIDQLDALLPIKDNLELGSLIIVTTRERDVLTYWNISSIYKMKTMKYFYAKQLFCWHAFLQPFPKLGFEKLVEKFTSACNGLPLSLKVLGGQLYYYSNKDLWEDLLLKISKILPEDIKNRLRVSYDSLDEEEKQIFLDVACFFIGEDYKKTIAIWEGSGWSGLHSWERLVNKCFVDLDSNNQIRMHDHFRDLGREIANTQLPCRLWSRDQITGIQKQEEEKIQIRGMILNAANNGVQEFPGFLLNPRRLSLPEFKIFVVKGNYGDNLPIAEFSTNLAWLSCTGIADRNLPLKMENLRVLELYKSRQLVGLWKDVLDAPMQLRVLIVSDCPKLGRIPKSIECLKNLKQMSLYGCKNVKGLPEEFCRLELLEHLQLKHCEKLSSLPSCFGELINLQHLDLSYSYKLRRLPDSFKKMKLLQHLNLSWCKRLVLQPDILEKMTKLEYLNFSNCYKLRNLPGHITKQPALRELYSEKTYLRGLPMDIGQLSNLRVIKIGSHFKIQALPESMGNLNHLEHLALDSLKTQSLPISFTRLTNLQTLEISNCPIRKLDCGQGQFTSLSKVDLYKTEMSMISISEECCPRLVTLALRHIKHLRKVEPLPTTMEKIEVMNCPKLEKLPSFSTLASLKVVELRALHNIEKLEGLQHCTSLENLLITDCPKLNVLPSFAKLASLKAFEFRKGNKVEKIQGLEHCSAMEQLVVENTSWEVPGIESLEQMHRLRMLQLVVKKKAALEPCISKMQKQKWPGEIIICTKAVPDAESILKSSAFPNLSVLHSFVNKKIQFSDSLRTAILPFLELKVRGNSSSNNNATMLCLVINCVSPRMELVIMEDNQICKRKDDPIYRGMDDPSSKSVDDTIDNLSSTEIEKGKWVWIGVFKQCSTFLTAPVHRIVERRNDGLFGKLNRQHSEVEKGLLVTGDENNIMESFYHILKLLGD